MAVHWWQTDKLVEELATDGVSEKNSLSYAVIAAILYTWVTYYATWFGGYRSWLLLIEFAAVCLVAIVGLQECFKANGDAGGNHFIKRLYCLSVPVGLKVNVASLIVGQSVYYAFPSVVTTANFRDPYFVYQVLSFTAAGFFTVFYFWRIAYHMDRIVKATRSNLAMRPTVGESSAADLGR